MNQLPAKIRRFFFQEFIPVTKTMAVFSGVVTVLYYLLYLLARFNLGSLLVLDPNRVWRMPWTFVTYPFFNTDLLSVILAILWLWFVGGSLERSWGSWKYGLFVLAAVVATGVLMTLTTIFFVADFQMPISGLLLPLVAITWAWAELYPDQEMLFFGIIPIRARWTAWIAALLQFYPYLYLSLSASSYGWLLGLVSLTGIPVAYLFHASPFSGSRGYRRWNPGISAKNRYESTRTKANRKKFRVIK